MKETLERRIKANLDAVDVDEHSGASTARLCQLTRDDVQALVAEYEGKLRTVRELNDLMNKAVQDARETVDRVLAEKDALAVRLQALEKKNEDLKVQLADVPREVQALKVKMRGAFGTGVEWYAAERDLLPPPCAEVDAAFKENFPEFE